MRISDWSSDVCSSDLPGTAALLLSFELLVAKPGKPAIFGMLPAAKTRGIGWLRGIEGYKGFAHPIMDFDRIEVPFEGTNVDKALCSSFKPVAHGRARKIVAKEVRDFL